jgi:hypothetical protein
MSGALRFPERAGRGGAPTTTRGRTDHFLEIVSSERPDLAHAGPRLLDGQRGMVPGAQASASEAPGPSTHRLDGLAQRARPQGRVNSSVHDFAGRSKLLAFTESSGA